MISRRLLMAAAAGATLPITAGAQTGLRWEKRPGKAFQIAIGANGQIWCLGVDAVPGGFPVFKWEGNAWKKVPGGLVSLAVDAQGQPWGTNEAKAIFRMQGGLFFPFGRFDAFLYLFRIDGLDRQVLFGSGFIK